MLMKDPPYDNFTPYKSHTLSYYSIVHYQIPNNVILNNNSGYISSDKVYFLVNLKGYHARVLYCAVRENIDPIELTQYGLFQYWASSTGQGTREKDQQWTGLSNCILSGLRPELQGEHIYFI